MRCSDHSPATTNSWKLFHHPEHTSHSLEAMLNCLAGLAFDQRLQQLPVQNHLLVAEEAEEFRSHLQSRAYQPCCYHQNLLQSIGMCMSLQSYCSPAHS